MGARTKSGLPGIYNSSALVLADGDGVALAVNSAGILQAYEAYLAAGEDLTNDVQKVEQRFSYTHVAAGQATTVIKASAGFLHSITFNGPATATNVTTVYDNASTSGTVIAIPLATATSIPVTVFYDVSFLLGLVIITTTANGADMTVSYR